MAFTAFTFTQFMNKMATKTVNVTSDPFRVILLNATTTGLAAIQQTAVTMTDVKAATGFTELATSLGGSNYTQNANSHSSGVAISSPTWTRSSTTWTLSTATSPSWTTAGSAFNPAYAVFFDDIGGTDATNFAVCYWDFGGALVGNGGTYTLVIPAGGIWNATGA